MMRADAYISIALCAFFCLKATMTNAKQHTTTKTNPPTVKVYPPTDPSKNNLISFRCKCRHRRTEWSTHQLISELVTHACWLGLWTKTLAIVIVMTHASNCQLNEGWLITSIWCCQMNCGNGKKIFIVYLSRYLRRYFICIGPKMVALLHLILSCLK